MEEDSVPKSMSPLIKTLRPFGLYFIRKQVAAAASSESDGGCRSWNGGRLYATIILVATYLNAARRCTIFDGRESIGADLFAKLMTIASSVFVVILHTAYYVASHAGSLDRVFRQLDSPTNEHSSKYSRKAKTVTVVCWLLLAANAGFHVYLMMFSGEEYNDLSLMFFINTFRLRESYVYVVKVVFFIQELQLSASSIFSQAMNNIPSTFHCKFSSSDVAILWNFVSKVNDRSLTSTSWGC